MDAMRLDGKVHYIKQIYIYIIYIYMCVCIDTVSFCRGGVFWIFFGKRWVWQMSYCMVDELSYWRLMYVS